MRIYLFDELEKFNYEDVFELLSPDRQQKVLKYKSSASRNLSAAAYMLLRFAVKDFAGVCEVPEIILDRNGKPRFKAVDSPRFNLSHCRCGVACGISAEEIGIDIQDVRRISAGTVQKTMCPQEQEIITKAEDPEREFARIWSMKESYVKLSGKGLSFGLKNIDTTKADNIKTFEFEHFFVSAAGNGEVQSEPKFIKYTDLIKD